MQQITLGHSNLICGALGLGCNKLLDPSNPTMVEAANTAIDLGITMFDGADMYGRGQCEQFFAKVLKPRRKEVLLVSKFGVTYAPDGTQGINVAPTYVRQACDASLQRLGMDHIDLYYQHRMSPDIPIEDTIGAMVELKNAGKIGAIGISNTTPELIRRAHAVHPISAVQMEYSLMARGVEAEILPVCAELGITFVAWGPLTYAFLAGRVKSTADLPAGDVFRRRQSRFTDEAIEHNATMLAVLDDIASQVKATPSQVALAWCYHRSTPILAIPGSTQPKHLSENAVALAIKLTKDQVFLLDKTFSSDAVKGNVGA